MTPAPRSGFFFEGKHPGGTNTEQAMKNTTPLKDLSIDVSAALPAVGDRKRIPGSAELLVPEGYDMEFEPGDAVSWTLELRRIAGAVEIAGEVSGEVTLLCYRCLEEFVFPLSLHLKEHAIWLNGAAEQDEEISGDYEVTDGVLDLEPVLRDAIALAFPVRRVCSEDCRGLCVRCGTNLNLEQCGCEQRPADVRLSPLAELKKRLEQEAG
jgi:uncharacterized protein